MLSLRWAGAGLTGVRWRARRPQGPGDPCGDGPAPTIADSLLGVRGQRCSGAARAGCLGQRDAEVQFRSAAARCATSRRSSWRCRAGSRKRCRGTGAVVAQPLAGPGAVGCPVSDRDGQMASARTKWPQNRSGCAGLRRLRRVLLAPWRMPTRGGEKGGGLWQGLAVFRWNAPVGRIFRFMGGRDTRGRGAAGDGGCGARRCGGRGWRRRRR